jgi:putative ABC transport system substrate-binding protein
MHSNAESNHAPGHRAVDVMTYGPNFLELSHRGGTYAEKFWEGAKPLDLLVEQSTKFQMTLNLKTAKQIGLTIPPNVLARADSVIK